MTVPLLLRWAAGDDKLICVSHGWDFSFSLARSSLLPNFSHETMDHYPEVKRSFLDTRALSSPPDQESESESSQVSGSDTPSPSIRTSARFPSATPPHEENGSSERSSGVEPESSKGWYEFDLSVILALASPIGNWLTGGDHVKNFLLILLLIFYLHQIIESKCLVFILKQKI